MDSKKKFIILLAIGLLAPAIVCWRLFEYGDWTTGANRFQWFDGNGSAIMMSRDGGVEEPNCLDSDIGMNSLAHDNALWATCSLKNESDEKKGFARMDPLTGVGTIWWYPKQLPHVYTKGVAVGPDREVAIVYQAHDLLHNGRLCLGILDKDNGWIFGPEELPDAKYARLLAISWASGQLTLLYTNLKSSPTAVWMTTFNGAKVATRKIPGLDGMHYQPFSAFIRNRQWHVILVDTDKNKYYATNTNGDILPYPEMEKAHWLMDCVEFDVVGRTRTANAVSLNAENALQQTLDGKLTPVKQPPVDTWFPRYGPSWLEPVAGGLDRIPLWAVDRDLNASVWPLGDQWLVIGPYDSNPNDNIGAHLLDMNGERRISRAIFFRSSSLYCGSLFAGIPLVRKEGGFWLVSRDGCYITVGDDLTREDPLPVLEHLRDRGSMSPEWNERQHVVAFFLTFFSLPLCLGISGIISKLRKKRTLEALRYGAMVNILISFAALYRVFPLLQ